jgi:hypothetical protein
VRKTIASNDPDDVHAEHGRVNALKQPRCSFRSYVKKFGLTLYRIAAVARGEPDCSQLELTNFLQAP